jgi:translation initiation factor 3 subunit A
LQQQREDEALARREAARAAATRKPVAAPTAVPASVRASAGKEDNLWRRSTPVPSHGATAAAPPAPLRSESPAPKYRPGALSAAGGGGGWRQREEAAKAAAGGGGGGGRPGAIPPRVTASPRPNSPAPLKDEPKKDEDGFQTVPTRGAGAGDRGGVWRPNRGGRA